MHPAAFRLHSRIPEYSVLSQARCRCSTEQSQPYQSLSVRRLSLIHISIDEWLNAAEYIIAEGNPNVVLCERGIRTFEKATRNTLDLSAVPVIRKKSHLPILVDPSHGTGVRDYVAPMAKAAVAAGADGIAVEVHPCPSCALSDGPQSLTFSDFDKLCGELRPYAALSGRTF